jgi:hypothetical protein
MENLTNNSRDFEIATEILDAIPGYNFLLDAERRIVYSNSGFLMSFNVNSLEELTGKLPGNALECKSIQNGENSLCGNTKHCEYCGVFNTIKKSQQTGQKSTGESTIITKNSQNEIQYDFGVTAYPVKIAGINYTMLSLQNISGEKRKRALEKIFFHDIINTAGSLNGLLENLQHFDDEEEIEELTELAKYTSRELIDEILAQKDLIAAENNDLKVHRTALFSMDILKNCLNKLLHHSVAKDKIILLDSNASNVAFTSDKVLLSRVITNMIKNAIEATADKDRITVGCDVGKNKIIFWVHNASFIPEGIQLQIFRRFFSTKEKNRGLGSYSMKLLTERYLKGKVYFKTCREDGTRFFVELPI